MARPTKIRPEDVLAIGDRLRALRISTGLTQAEFAEKYGFKQTQWGNFEAAHSRIGIDAALTLLRELKTPLDWIYTGDTTWLPSGLRDKIEAVEPRPVKRAPGADRN